MQKGFVYPNLALVVLGVILCPHNVKPVPISRVGILTNTGKVITVGIFITQMEYVY